MSVYLAEHDLTLHQGDAAEVLATLPAGSANCVVTSPPYYGLRDYGVAGQIGLEASPAAYVETLRATFAEVRRVLADNGVLWLNLGDSYYSGRGNPGPNSADEKQEARRGWVRALDRPGQDWAKPKDLLGIPWRVAFALQDDGWTLRNAVVWSKPNAMPESITDRLANRYEHVFLFSRSRRYWFDLDAIREPLSLSSVARYATGTVQTTNERLGMHKPGARPASDRTSVDPARLNALGKNPGDVWSIPTTPYPEAHFATFPPELARRCIAAGCPPDGTVLDPFAGSGTTLMVARRLMRDSIGIELSPGFCALAVERIGQPVFDFGEAG